MANQNHHNDLQNNKVSVILPCFNHAHFLPYAIDSLCNQTFPAWEAIIVDDGSTDDTAAVSQRFEDRRIRYVFQDNQGLAAARNAGIRLASGEYLIFLDADDALEPEFVDNCLEKLAANSSIAGIYVLYSFIDESNNLLPQQGGIVYSPDLFKSRILEGGFFPPCAAMVRSEIFHFLGGFNNSMPGLEDWDLWIRLSRTQTMVGLEVNLARYRVSPGSMSTDSGLMHTSRLAVLSSYFGDSVDGLEKWTAKRRLAYGFAYRSSALESLMQNESNIAWKHMDQAIHYWPDLLVNLDTFYELACGNQPKGYRGQAEYLDLEANSRHLFAWLEKLFGNSNQEVKRRKDGAYAHAFLALSVLSNQVGSHRQARNYLQQAVKLRPRFLKSAPTLASFMKLQAKRIGFG